MQVLNMETKTEATYIIKIYLSGDIGIIKQECRRFCKEIGLCVTINKTLFIYTGGEEYGVEIGLINYPRFPDTPEKIRAKAIELASRCRDATHQHSYLVVDAKETVYNTTRSGI